MRIVSLILILVAVISLVIGVIYSVKVCPPLSHSPAGYLNLTNTILLLSIALLLYQISGSKQ